MISPGERGIGVKRLFAVLINVGLIAIVTVVSLFPVIALRPMRFDYLHQLMFFFAILLIPAIASILIGWTESTTGVSRGMVAMGLERRMPDGSAIPVASLKPYTRLHKYARRIQFLYAVVFFVMAFYLLSYSSISFSWAKTHLIRFCTATGAVVVGALIIVSFARWRLVRRNGWRICERAPAPLAPAELPAMYRMIPTTRAADYEIVGPVETSRLSVVEQPLRAYAASRRRRLLAGLLDCAVMFSVLVIILVFIEAFAHNRFTRATEEIVILLTFTLATAQLLGEAICGLSFGKLLTGTIVLRTDGLRPSPVALLARVLIRYAIPATVILIEWVPRTVSSVYPSLRDIPSEWLIFFWFAFAFLSTIMPVGRGWYDYILNTRVFRREALHANLNVNAFEVQLRTTPAEAIPIAEPVFPSTQERD